MDKVRKISEQVHGPLTLIRCGGWEGGRMGGADRDGSPFMYDFMHRQTGQSHSAQRLSNVTILHHIITMRFQYESENRSNATTYEKKSNIIT